jgi:tripartite-type tricarboxylate transporter receptor subunit TctC
MRRLIATAVACVALCAAAGVVAQGFPVKPIRIVVPYPAGGATDQQARIIQQPLQDVLGQPIVIDNRAGAAGAIGTEAVAKSVPDGYTLVFGNSGPNAMAPAIKKTPYDPVKDLAPISFVASVPLILATHPSVPVNSAKELIDVIRAKPGQFNYGSVGIGSASHLISEHFAALAGLKITHVPYKGGAPAMVGFITGEVQTMLMTGLDGMQHARAGKLKVLAIATEKRSELAPGVPALAETVPGFTGTVWFGLLAPAGTPRGVIDVLHAAVAKAVEQPQVKKAFADLYVEAVSNTPEQFAKVIAGDLALWTRIVKESSAKFE